MDNVILINIDLLISKKIVLNDKASARGVGRRHRTTRMERGGIRREIA